VELLYGVVSMFISLLEQQHSLSKVVVKYVENSCYVQPFNYDTIFCSICLQKIFIHSALYFKMTPCDLDIIVVFCCGCDAFSIAVNIWKMHVSICKWPLTVTVT